MKLSANQKEVLVAILNEEAPKSVIELCINYLFYNQNTLRALKKRGLIEYVDTGVTINTKKGAGTIKRMKITKLGKEVAFKELGF